MNPVPTERQDTAKSFHGNHDDTVVNAADSVAVGTDSAKQEKYNEKPNIDKAFVVRFSVFYSQKQTAEGAYQSDDKQGNRCVVQGWCIRYAAIFKITAMVG